MRALRVGFSIIALLLVTACASLPSLSGRTPSYAVDYTANTRLGLAFDASEEAHPSSDAFALLPNAIDALVARLVLAEAADRTLDLQYYIWHDDLTGRKLGASVLRAADRGVRVRILLDDLGTNADDQLLLALDSHPNVQIRLFNPVAGRTFKKLSALFEFARINRRMHNKAMIADNEAAIIGGRNIGDEYFGASTTVGFGDLDVLVHGPVVRDVSKAFDQFWNSDAAYPIATLVGKRAKSDALPALRAKVDAYLASEESSDYMQEAKRRISPLAQNGNAGFTWGQAKLLYDDPTKIERARTDDEGHLITQFREMNLRPTHSMLVVSPYFVPGKDGLDWLNDMSRRGVDVKVLTNSLAATDVAAVHAGYRRYRETLLEDGVQLFELRPDPDEGPTHKSTFGSSHASLHAKTYVFDRQTVFIGSMNLDARSVELNTEIGLYCMSPEIAAQVADGIESQLNRTAWHVELQPDAQGAAHLVWLQTEPDGSVVQYRTEPGASDMRRIEVWFLGLLPIESQL
ncbi:phospholipase D family protein [Pararobbsia silviterrae]|uniref:Phospholipase D family protein n=1 Tax=Pararobbsia silviterrae TaxID=1792498 RepID=A0A494XWQ4_9BURK|nr:phospholipase D family protein [Pararobbsia silviterrae]RKP53416.1 phospholipase D family protein [Pararobbsia silviterrae]